MKKFYVFAAMAALAIAACTKPTLDTDDVNKDDNGNNEVVESIEGVVFNEFDGTSKNKFIELYNTGDKEVSLEGVTIVKYDATKEGGKSVTWTGAAGLKLAAKSWIYLESSDLADPAEKGDSTYVYQSPNHIFNGGLSPKKNLKFELYGADEKLLDTFTRGEEGSKGWNVETLETVSNSFARIPDGTGEWVLAESTKGSANGPKVGEIE